MVRSFRHKHDADIYSHLNYASKLNVAITLTNVFGGEVINMSRQDDEEAKALLTSLFRGAEHEQAEQIQEKPTETLLEADEGEFMDVLEEELETPEKMSLDEDLAELEKSVAEYKKAKVEMQRLGFEDYDEYLDYLEFTRRKVTRKSNIEM